MGTVLPGSRSAKEEAFRRLAEGLATETSAETILEQLKRLCKALDDQLAEGGNLPWVFLLAGGVHTVIGLLKGAPTSDPTPDPMSMTIASAAGVCLDKLTCCWAIHTMLPADLLIPPLMSALGDAPHINPRKAAAKVMVSVAASKPEQRRAMAEAGVIGLVLAFLLDVGDKFSDGQEVGSVWWLARELLRWEMSAVRDIRRAMCSSDADLVFTAVTVLTDSIVSSLKEEGCGSTVALEDDGVVIALTIALKGDSLKCVTAAAKLLNFIIERRTSTIKFIPALIRTLRDAPHPRGRAGAAQALATAAERDTKTRMAIAEAGVIGVVLALFLDAGKSTWDVDEVGPVWELVVMLLRWESAAVRDLRRAICTPNEDLAFPAVDVLRFSLEDSGSDLMGALDKGGLAKALVSALTHESPYCAAAAAAALSKIGGTPGGQELLVACGAIPALVHAIKTPRPLGNAEKNRDLFSRPSVIFNLHAKTEAISLNKPTAMALGVLCTADMKPGRFLNSFLASGGVSAVVRLLDKSTCPAVLQHAATLIGRMLNPANFSGSHPRALHDLADKYFQAGLDKAALEALKKQIPGTHRSILNMLFMFLGSLSDHFEAGAMAALLPGGLVEITMAHMAEAEADELLCALGLFKSYLRFPVGQEDMRVPAIRDQLIKWMARWLSEADWPALSYLGALLNSLLDSHPCFVHAAIEANVIPGLVRLFRQVRIHGNSVGLEGLCIDLDGPFGCIKQLMWHDSMDTRGLWRSTMEAGMVPVLIDLLKVRDEPTVRTVLEVSGILLMSGPKGEVCQWGSGLVRDTARLLRASPPVALRYVAETLTNVGLSHPELIADWRTWGIEDNLQRLTSHRDRDVAAAACRLKELLSYSKQEQDLEDKLAGVQVSSHSANISNPSADPTLDGDPGNLKPAKKRRSRKKKATVHAKTKDEQAFGASHPQSPGDGVSLVGPSSPHGFRGTVWACAKCGIMAEGLDKENRKLRECGRCQLVRYCGTECQHADWPAHKAACKRMQVEEQ